MKIYNSSSLLFILLLSMTGVDQAIGQAETFSVESVEVLVTGGSTLHDWQATCSEVIEYPATLSLDLQEGGVIEDFTFKVGVHSMDGGRGATMNKKILKALKAETHPYIQFMQNNPSTYPGFGDGGSSAFSVVGMVSVAGVNKEITVDVTATLDGDILTMSGEQAMQLSEYDIEPPTAMFGQIKTKNDISVIFEFKYKKQ